MAIFFLIKLFSAISDNVFFVLLISILSAFCLCTILINDLVFFFKTSLLSYSLALFVHIIEKIDLLSFFSKTAFFLLMLETC